MCLHIVQVSIRLSGGAEPRTEGYGMLSVAGSTKPHIGRCPWMVVRAPILPLLTLTSPIGPFPVTLGNVLWFQFAHRVKPFPNNPQQADSHSPSLSQASSARDSI